MTSKDALDSTPTKDPIDDVPVVPEWDGTSLIIAVASEEGECGWYREPCQSPIHCVNSCLRLARHQTAKMKGVPPFTYTITRKDVTGDE